MTRKGYLLATASSLATVAVAGGAQAADMPLKYPVAAPAASWAGWYVGLNAGAAWQQGVNNDAYELFTLTTTGTSFIGGGQIGYNWQDGNFVYGLEGDIQGLTSGGTLTGTEAAGKGASNSITWLSTVRARTGLAVGNTMVYATGGLAVGGVKNSVNLGGSAPKSEATTRLGWTVGGGVEHMIDQHWSLGVEALFVDLGSSSVTNTVVPAFGAKTIKFSNQAVIGRFKVNYKW
jgi:outer membrane immunogenic protein